QRIRNRSCTTHPDHRGRKNTKALQRRCLNVSKGGLPTGVKMRHDSHYVEAIAQRSRAIGKTISIDMVEPNPEQPRNEFGDLKELTASIKEKGVLEPLLVKPK